MKLPCSFKTGEESEKIKKNPDFMSFFCVCALSPENIQSAHIHPC
jgi:hypothetical protein